MGLCCRSTCHLLVGFLLLLPWLEAFVLVPHSSPWKTLLQSKPTFASSSSSSSSVSFASSTSSTCTRSHASRISSSSSTALGATAWASAVSTKTDLEEAVQDAVQMASAQLEDINEIDMAMFFISSIYETSCTFIQLNEYLRKNLPKGCNILGCTTGGAVGPLEADISNPPAECEARLSIGVILSKLGGKNDKNVSVCRFSMDKNAIQEYVTDKTKRIQPTSDGDNMDDKKAISFMFAAESSKPVLSQFLSTLSERENVEPFGAFASGVSGAYTSKVFIATEDDADLLKLNSGLVGIQIRGDFFVKTVVAKSCLPVGPRYKITKRNDNEVMMLQAEDESEEEASSPLEKLDIVLSTISPDNADSLKRELLLGIVPASEQDMQLSDYFFGQKPVSFDPLTGSITAPSMPHGDAIFQFCVRDNSFARRDATLARMRIGKFIESMEDKNINPLALLMLGSTERGTKVFRHQSWESMQLYNQMKKIGRGETLPVSGFLSFGTFSRIGANEPKVYGMMETDSLYAVISNGEIDFNEEETNVLKTTEYNSIEDVMSSWELEHFNDFEDDMLISKKDSESAAAVRVAGMDYFVPDKVPQPMNVLESLVWDREKNVDSQKEKFPQQRAMLQAKVAEGKFPKRDLIQAIKCGKLSTMAPLPIIISASRNSLHNGKSAFAIHAGSGQLLMDNFAKEVSELGATAVGTHVDANIYRGTFEDLEDLKKSGTVPVICDDFVIYGYQVFRAKAAGADAIKIMMSINTAKETTYLVKMANAIGITPIVVVSSKTQMLDALENVQGIDILSVTSRNMRLWKIDTGKAHRILTDEDVAKSLKKRKDAATAEGKDFLVMQEGFAHSGEIEQAKKDDVDVVMLGEELALYNDENVELAVKRYI